MIRALPSYWRGTVFRSRIEARWAVFFAAIGLKWDYEPEGYMLESGAYLPDFWLPEMRMFAEVKPDVGATDEERLKVEELAAGTGHEVLLLTGSPRSSAYEVCSPKGAPWGDWWWARFSKRYTIDRKDGRPRLFSLSDPDEDEIDDPWIEAAASIARNMDVKTPIAGNYLPLGWEETEIVL